MRTYILHVYQKDGTFKEYSFKAQNKDDLRKKAIGKVPDGRYGMYSLTGYPLGTVIISKKSIERAEKKRGFVPKEQYDQLYYFTQDFIWELMKDYKKSSPLGVIRPRRYDSLDDARKSAIARSYKDFKEISELGYTLNRGKSITQFVFKGDKYLGSVTYNVLKDKVAYAFWSTADHPKDLIPLNKDGTIKR